MASRQKEEDIRGILAGLDSLDGLKRLFWQELNYERENKPLSTRLWPEPARQALAEAPVLLASGGEEKAFHIVYCRLATPDLRRGPQRPVVNQLLREHPYALFVFSNKGRTDWHFLNVKYDEEADKRRLFRRITVRHGLPAATRAAQAGEGLRTAAERLCMLDLVDGVGRVDSELSPLAIQSAHDAAFDVEKVSKDFYREIANWYFWALKHVNFPKDAPKEQDGRDHISVIRLITRLIFCWFIREKNLIPGALFDESKLAGMLNGFAPGEARNKDSVFYRAILQNLFFATLNTEMDQRGWRRDDQNFMAHSLYRHKECFRDPKDGLEWFKNIPFLNGGLFECLDRDFGEGAKPRYLRVDGFSDRADSRPTVPDFLFFGSEQDVDLSADYGDKKFRSVRVRGLIDTLSRYKFTIEENTPFDQEVALDPELCGKVFENLLAAYNPETGTTARKATGSFYTPREIVDYMVDESLVAYLRGRLVNGVDKVDDEKADKVDAQLRTLLSYEGETPVFGEEEIAKLIEAIDTLKALDPAVGSGAFPMGLLHKLVHILGKLDPGNKRWKATQLAKLDDAAMREDAERLFRDNYDDYGRKLYLIENCIYGVDIQPIAVQIAKMRFFISLIVDQKINPDAPNLGVRALPNLETKFVAANTLIGIEKPEQMMLRNPDIDKKEAELRQVREKHFTARTLKSKAKCREDDKRLRAEIAELLKDDGWDNTTAKQLAAWDPYDQNASSDFFDPEWMFGVKDGFDVVIGNPPYVQLQKNNGELADLFHDKGYATFARTGDIYCLFYELGIKLSTIGGTLTYITSNKWLRAGYGQKTRAFLSKHNPLRLIDLGPNVFSSAVVDTNILLIERTEDPPASHHLQALDLTTAPKVDNMAQFSGEWVTISNLSDSAWIISSAMEQRIRDKIEAHGTPLKDWNVTINYGIKTGYNEAFIIDGATRERLIAADKNSAKIIKPLLRGRDIKRYQAHFNDLWLIATLPALNININNFPAIKHYLKQFGRRLYQTGETFVDADGNYTRSRKKTGNKWYETQDQISYHQDFEKEKIVFQEMVQSPIFAYDANAGYICLDTARIITGENLKYLVGILNSKLFFYGVKTFYGGGCLGSEGVRMKHTFFQEFSVPKPLDSNSNPIIALVDRILSAKAADPAADTSALEREIDELVYQLYGLTAEEIAIVEGATPGKGGSK